jgi:L-2-hydroxyglutarate oxidase LhgO
MRADAVVIGGGVVGLAVAARLARDGLAVVLLERHPAFGRETSSRNSEVVHAGMYYPAGSLKARLCVAGNRSIYAWCEARGVATRRIGKFIIATAGDEVPALEGILARGRENDVPGLRWAEPGELAAAEPEVRAVGALYSPDTGIIDSHGLMQSLADAATGRGAALAWGHEYLGAEPSGPGYRVRFREPGGAAGEIETARVVNAAGLSADLVAAGLGLDVDALGYRLTYVKGNYFRLAGSWRGRLKHLVYPVPHAGLAGLGCHVTLDLAGDIRLGPDVEFLSERIVDYSVSASRAARFAEAVGTYLPGITEADLMPGQSGIRARRVTGNAAPPDFVIAEESAAGFPGWVNLVGIESPGLTCCLEIADEVARLLA